MPRWPGPPVCPSLWRMWAHGAGPWCPGIPVVVVVVVVVRERAGSAFDTAGHGRVTDAPVRHSAPTSAPRPPSGDSFQQPHPPGRARSSTLDTVWLTKARECPGIASPAICRIPCWSVPKLDLSQTAPSTAQYRCCIQVSRSRNRLAGFEPASHK